MTPEVLRPVPFRPLGGAEWGLFFACVLAPFLAGLSLYVYWSRRKIHDPTEDESDRQGD